MFASYDEGKRFTLCIDEEFSGCNLAGIGERLFDADGKQALYLKSVMNFSREFQGQFNLFVDKGC